MIRYKSFLTAPCMLAVCFIGVASAADGVSETGSRVGSGATKLAVLQLNESTVVDEVQRLLDQGKTTDAIALARDYVDSFQSQQSFTLAETVPESYFALNALCVALTRNRDYDEAIETCTQAIRIQPRRWSAINNRGTAHYAAGRYGDALSDYRLALSVAPDDGNIRDTIWHNIALAEPRVVSFE
jgi:tetratricopeptide (TPR) repeat protein